MKIEIKNIEKKIKEKYILRGINLNFEGGDIVGVIGDNGSGKTTLMKIIGNIDRETAGEILLNNEDMKVALVRLDIHIGILIESPALYNNITGEENLYVKYATSRNKHINKRKVKNIMKEVGLNSISDKKVKTYSLGMKQKLAIAVALVDNPQILVLDEPHNGLDPKGVKIIKEILKKRSNENTIIIISSHLLDEVYDICNKFILLDNGKVKVEIIKEDLIKNKISLKDFYYKARL